MLHRLPSTIKDAKGAHRLRKPNLVFETQQVAKKVDPETAVEKVSGKKIPEAMPRTKITQVRTDGKR